jgi:hypothetical protein
VFRWDDTAWVETARLIPSDNGRRHYFGISVAIHDNTLFAGAIGDPVEPGYGSVYVYTRDDNGTPQDPSDDTWMEAAKLRPSSAEYVTTFGVSMSLDVDRLLVGATMAFCDGRGDAFVFRREGSEWIQEAHLIPPNAYMYDDDAFGLSVSLAGDLALIGAWRYGNVDCTFSGGWGAAYLFKRRGAEWVGQPRIMDPDPIWLERFGYAVAVSSQFAVIGSPYGDAATFVVDVDGVSDCNGNGILDSDDIASGSYQDANGDCVPDNCQPGACCDQFTGTCTDAADDVACVDEYFAWYENMTCAAVPCDPLMGACCITLTGTCLEETVGPDCLVSDGVWTPDAACGQIICEPATGACCDVDTGECTDSMVSADCTAANLEWHRDRLCADIDCQPPFVAVPATSSWGLGILVLLVCILSKMRRNPARSGS